MPVRRDTATLAWALWGFVVAIVVAGIILLLRHVDLRLPEGAFAFRGYAVPLALAFATVGRLVASRRPANPIGWILLACGVLAAVTQLGFEYAAPTIVGDEELPGAVWAAWLQEWIWIPVLPMLALTLLLLPEGRLQPGGRWLARWLVGAAGLATLGTMIKPGPMETFGTIANPAGLSSLTGLRGDIGQVVFVPLGVGLIATAISFGRRLHRTAGEERAQLRWIAVAGALLAVSFAFYGVAWATLQVGAVVDLLEILLILAITGIPLAVGAAVLRYRLYDVDLVINKVVVVGLLVAFITVVYVGVVVGVGAFLGGRADPVLSAAAAAAVAVAFDPVRRRARRLADRVVFGERATPYEVLSEFGKRVSDTYGVEDALPRMARILGEGTGAAGAQVWLVVGPELQLAASWPPVDVSATAKANGGRTLDDTDVRSPVRHDGELLGVLAISKAPGDPPTPADVKLVDDLARQAGLVLRNASLIADLRASRRRLVAAQDEERRRLERDLHDGAQQQLVALGVRLRLLEAQIRKDPERATELAGELQGDAQDALEELRRLSRGIYPPLLADRGLAAALTAQARKSTLTIDIDADGHRYAADVEAAVYFSCLEALQNVAKYSQASRATLQIAREDGLLRFQVVDDGVGFDAGETTTGTGLQGIEDRLAALGGTLRLHSAPGEGTRLMGEVPVGAETLSG